MTTKKLGQWCQSMLPPNFQQVNASTASIQQFLREQLPEPMNQQVSVINLSAEHIVVSVTSAQLANYLRLYVAELQQQIQETFKLTQSLKIRTMPDSMLRVTPLPGAARPSRVSAQTVESIQRNADSVEDESLKQALQSLAKSLKQK